jgi:hypothetical protein
MALLDRLVLKHNFDTDHIFVVLKKTARNKLGRTTYGCPLNRHADFATSKAKDRVIQVHRQPQM